MCDNNELEIRMVFAFIDDAGNNIAVIMNLPNKQRKTLLYQTGSEGVYILSVQSICRLIQCKDAAILTKRVRKGKADDDRRQHLLPS